MIRRPHVTVILHRCEIIAADDLADMANVSRHRILRALPLYVASLLKAGDITAEDLRAFARDPDAVPGRHERFAARHKT